MRDFFFFYKFSVFSKFYTVSYVTYITRKIIFIYKEMIMFVLQILPTRK